MVEYAGSLYVIARFMTPLSEKDWIMADETDDGYLAYLVDENANNIQNDKEGNILLNHRHPQCTDLFPPRFPISKKIKIRIDNLQKILRIENDFEE